ncbi:MAG: hypothetical protein IPM64_03830 [Phycisphaerales bacterium]|nr:hypothetical protein [Phycisphaerales bacterium]
MNRGSRIGRSLASTALLLAAVWLFHRTALHDGSVLDDHWHQHGLRTHGWALNELLRTLTIDTRDFIELWWQDRPIRWEYARPLFILAMKTVYGPIGGHDPFSLHAYSLLLHAAAVLLTWRLCLWLTGRRGWALVGGLIFAVYPHAVITVAWPSSQNCVQQTVLLLGALLCYIRASGLRPGWDVASRPETNGPPLQTGWFAAVMLLWLLALGTRENALLFPAVFASFDFAFGGGRRTLLRRAPAYAAFLLIGAAFVAWRMSVVTQGMPDVYQRRPDGDLPGYALWCAAKLLHYVTAAIWFAPMTVGPTGRFDPWTDSPGDCLLMLSIVAVLWGGYAVACRRVRGAWIWPLWVVLAVLPVTPVIATPHSGYFCGVGVAAMLCVSAALGHPLTGQTPRSGTHPAETTPAAAGPPRTRRTMIARLNRAWTVTFLVGTLGMSGLNRWQWDGTIAAERWLLSWVRADPPPPAAEHVFFINLPLVNIYTAAALSREIGLPLERVRVHALTIAPQAELFEELCVVEAIGPCELRVRMISGQSYFSRLVGRFFLEGGRDVGALLPGETIRTEHLCARIDEMDAEGVRQITFTFPRPLSDPAYCFYVVTPDCGAARLRFDAGSTNGNAASSALPILSLTTGAAASDELPDVIDVAAAGASLDAGRADAGRLLFAARTSAGAAIRREAEERLRDAALVVARALADPIQMRLEVPNMDEADWSAVEAWWNQRVDDEQLRVVWQRRFDFDALLKAREELPHARKWAAKVFRTDLYLTGPPWPGPRRLQR